MVGRAAATALGRAIRPGPPVPALRPVVLGSTDGAGPRLTVLGVRAVPGLRPAALGSAVHPGLRPAALGSAVELGTGLRTSGTGLPPVGAGVRAVGRGVFRGSGPGVGGVGVVVRAHRVLQS
ncbi:hypothetical protein ACFXB3_34620 [Streptomyces sp. NPDC059447]|uniref:hypothetical protein n=1 Tax=Streptomyces sp. NPDC059447 TaxID=3346834 RepID=UPI00369FBF76